MKLKTIKTQPNTDNDVARVQALGLHSQKKNRLQQLQLQQN